LDLEFLEYDDDFEEVNEKNNLLITVVELKDKFLLHIRYNTTKYYSNEEVDNFIKNVDTILKLSKSNELEKLSNIMKTLY
jgi:hypothetical protein